VLPNALSLDFYAYSFSWRNQVVKKVIGDQIQGFMSYVKRYLYISKILVFVNAQFRIALYPDKHLASGESQNI
jgi:hypothetical protein